MHPRFNIVVLSSPGGGLLARLLNAHDAPSCNFAIATVIFDREGARGLANAREHSVPTVVLMKSDRSGAAQYSERVWEVIETIPSVQGVLMLGWLHHICIPHGWTNRVVNVHPSLLPLFGGKGMWGNRVQEAVLNSGMRIAGSTYHFADNEYDHGPILHQAVVPVHDNDTVQSLTARVIEAQHQSLLPLVTSWASGQFEKAGMRFVGGPKSLSFGFD